MKGQVEKGKCYRQWEYYSNNSIGTKFMIVILPLVRDVIESKLEYINPNK